jgi:hypothetical protein
MGGSISLRK